MAIPNVINFCYFGGKHFSLVNYVAVKSAAVVNKPERIYFNSTEKPTGIWWDRALEFCTFVEIEPLEKAFGQKLNIPAHKADIWRLKKLISAGGIYLDTDVICNRPFMPLLNNSVVMGQEKVYQKTVGLCTAAILAQPGANFLKRWWDGYDPIKSLWRGFRSTGFDLYWTELSIKYTHFLSQYWPEEIEVVPFDQFFGFNWTEEDLIKFYETTEELPNAYFYHLWSTSAHDKYLKGVSESSLRANNTNFSKLMLQYL